MAAILDDNYGLSILSENYKSLNDDTTKNNRLTLSGFGSLNMKLFSLKGHIHMAQANFYNQEATGYGGELSLDLPFTISSIENSITLSKLAWKWGKSIDFSYSAPEDYFLPFYKSLSHLRNSNSIDSYYSKYAGETTYKDFVFKLEAHHINNPQQSLLAFGVQNTIDETLILTSKIYLDSNINGSIALIGITYINHLGMGAQ